MRDAATRRRFLGSSALLTAGCMIAGSMHDVLIPSSCLGEDPILDPDASRRKRLYRAVKWGMIGGTNSVAEKFAICKQLGYDGMELVSPLDGDLKEILAASAATGLPIHGVVNMRHWDVRMSSEDDAVRKQATLIMLTAMEDAKRLGGDTVLLVPGVVDGSKVTHDDVWQRSAACIRELLPTASRLGVRILIENVWNGFCETPELLRDYVDQFGSPWVGVYFDIGNALKFAPSQDWIRKLESRIVKLDVKDWSSTGGFGKITEGAVDWPEVRKALQEIGFTGWCTAEVAGGDSKRLAEIAANMDRALGKLESTL